MRSLCGWGQGEYKTLERGINSWRQTKLTLVSLITSHAKGILLQVFAKYYAFKVHLGFCVKWSGIEVGFFLASTIFVCLPQAAGYSETKKDFFQSTRQHSLCSWAVVVDTVIKITTIIIPFIKGGNIDARLWTKLNTSGKNGESPPCMTGVLLMREGNQSPMITKPILRFIWKALAI